MTRIGSNEKKVIEALKKKSLNRLEVASLFHSGNTTFSEWHRPSKACMSRAAKTTDALIIKGIIEPAGDSDNLWRRKLRLVNGRSSLVNHAVITQEMIDAPGIKFD